MRTRAALTAAINCSAMHSWILAISVIALYLLHQDFWFWRDARLVFGVLPVGLFYHALYCLACTGLMWALVTFAWPADLDDTGSHPHPHPARSSQHLK